MRPWAHRAGRSTSGSLLKPAGGGLAISGVFPHQSRSASQCITVRTHRPRGYAFVEFECSEDAPKALRENRPLIHCEIGNTPLTRCGHGVRDTETQGQDLPGELRAR
jgi:RNA recognition motif. (a.k.a. RRM, RBD, or RNP domain)